MSDLPLLRRLFLAALGIAASACILRAQLADGLVVRGDGWLYRSQPRRALSYYRRALWIDSGDGVAVDRFAFVAATLHDRRATTEGIRLASAYLRRRAGDATVRMDRAMAYRAIGRTAEALSDFAEVGRRTGDPRALTFAGYAALAIGQRMKARRLWRWALALQPGLPAALHALKRGKSR